MNLYRYQILIGEDEDGETLFAVMDMELQMIIGNGTFEEMELFIAKREEDDKLLVWK